MGKNQRKWRNILLDKNFQLSFTTLLVGVAALLMILLGFWVRDVAHNATEVQVHEMWTKCADLETAVANSEFAGSATPVTAPKADPRTKSQPMSQKSDETAQPKDQPAASAENSPAPNGSAQADDAHKADQDRPPSNIIMGETSMELLPAPARKNADALPLGPSPELIEDLARCNKTAAAEIDELWGSYRIILFVLCAVCGLLILGLGVHGLRMTHKVAGPLFKVGLYLEKLQKGTYDQVWNLRKGDQLTEFYEHFRAAHRELTHMQADDIAVLEKVIEAASAADLDSASPELKAALSALRNRLKTKRERLKVPEDKRD